MKCTNSKELNNIIKILIKKHDCTVKKGGKHYKIFNTRIKKTLTISSTPSDRNAHKALLRDVKKHFHINT